MGKGKPRVKQKKKKQQDGQRPPRKGATENNKMGKDN